ncbi:MAG: thioredoxin domain-containing protein [Gammaproteobacteria bacterium]|nr:thioredoxin domain-containing protein [Gammaproteobacteria bacterium]MDX2488780.1 thioredoxin domain-containing protein [Gammaproteobacteria bacterium]
MKNSLINETSPYLLQHADNPVHWQPWTPQALETARKEDKPILLSIGYAACHWCHVMEHESFEDEATADIMNHHFVCIKVDREERPDLDKIYQTAYQMLNQKGGGWPLNLFLSPENHYPFFAGTYFPPDARYGMPPFKVVLQRVADHFRNHRDELRQQNERMQQAFNDMVDQNNSGKKIIFNRTPLDQAASALINSFDSMHGGFGGAPKFPHPTNLQRCLRHAQLSNDSDAAKKLLEMCCFTLTRMSEGGLNDHVGGGFYRYSTDELWMIPHFEKMLYDNAQLIPLYIEAGMLCGTPAMLDVADRTCAWICSEMQSSEGGFYSSLDADSEGVEGRYYVWQNEEIIDLVSPLQWKLLRSRYGLEGKPNFEGSWHLHAIKTVTEVALEYELDQRTASLEIEQALALLQSARAKRIWPGLDDKILTAWNGMMIGAMSLAGDILEKTEYIQSAEQSLDFLRTHLWDGKRLKVTARNGKSQLNAYLDDYVLLASGVLQLLRVRWSSDDMRLLIQLLDCVLEHFEDRENGGFFFTSDDHEKLMTRMKPAEDDAIPSGNGIAASLLLNIGHLTGERKYLDAAEKTLTAFWNDISGYPLGHGSLLSALETFLQPPEVIILRGDTALLEKWRALAKHNIQPDRLVLAIPSEAEHLPGLLASKSAPAEGVLAYPCTGTICLPAISDIDEFTQYLQHHAGQATAV